MTDMTDTTEFADLYIHVGNKTSEMAALDQLNEAQQTVVNYIIGFLSSKKPESIFSDEFNISLAHDGDYLQVSVLHLSPRDDELLVRALQEGLPDYTFQFWGKSAIKFAFTATDQNI